MEEEGGGRGPLGPGVESHTIYSPKIREQGNYRTNHECPYSLIC